MQRQAITLGPGTPAPWGWKRVLDYWVRLSVSYSFLLAGVSHQDAAPGEHHLSLSPFEWEVPRRESWDGFCKGRCFQDKKMSEGAANRICNQPKINKVAVVNKDERIGDLKRPFDIRHGDSGFGACPAGF